MSNFKMDIYNRATGVQMTIRWANEDDTSLERSLNGPRSELRHSSDRREGKPAFFYLESQSSSKLYTNSGDH